MPLVSIVVPVYKVEPYLARCLDSIIAQTYRPMEVILVNDGSPDRSGEIIRRYEAQWPFIQSIWQENKGPGIARNVGITKATGKYLALIDSDDYVDPDFISGLVELAEKQNADVVVCNVMFEFSNGFKIPFPLMTLQKNMTGAAAAQGALLLLRIPIFAVNKLYRLSLFSENSVSFPAIYYEDVATTSRLLHHARKVAITHKAYYHYCLRRTGITGNFGHKNIKDFLQAVEIIREFIWTEQLWNDWGNSYRFFLRTVEAQLILQITLQKKLVPLKNRTSLIRSIHYQLKQLRLPPADCKLLPVAGEPYFTAIDQRYKE